MQLAFQGMRGFIVYLIQRSFLVRHHKFLSMINLEQTVWHCRLITIWVLNGENRISKAKIAKIARWVTEQYEVYGKITAISDKELAEQVSIHLPQYPDDSVLYK